MPIINVKNWPSKVAAMEWTGEHKTLSDSERSRLFIMMVVEDNAWKRNFAEALRKAVLAEDIPGIDDPRLVTVSFDDGRAFAEDMLLVIEVTGLFVRPDRTKDVRDHIAWALKECGKAHNGTMGCEVLIHRFDPEVDSYARG